MVTETKKRHGRKFGEIFFRAVAFRREGKGKKWDRLYSTPPARPRQCELAGANPASWVTAPVTAPGVGRDWGHRVFENLSRPVAGPEAQLLPAPGPRRTDRQTRWPMRPLGATVANLLVTLAELVFRPYLPLVSH